jgi:hypothetical protein
MASIFKAEIVLDGELSSADAQQKWEDTALKEARKARVKGKPLYIHARSRGKYVLYYYHNFGGDFCDTMFTGEIFEYDEGKSQITGKITASTAMKRFAVVLFLLSLPLALLFDMLMLYLIPYLQIMESYENNQLFQIFAFGGTVVTINAIAVLSLCIDNRRVHNIMEYLNDFLKDEQVSTTKRNKRQIYDEEVHS